MTDQPKVTTIGELRDSGYVPRTVRDEMRGNLIAALRSGRQVFGTIRGYETTVLPQIYNAVLAGHDIILLGERGQAKTRLAREMIALLDPWMPIVHGSETNDDPLSPVSHYGLRQVAEHGDETPVSWVSRDRRFSEKLATPDTTVADLIGEVDPIKVAEGRYLNNEEIISYGLIPRTNRGIFNLNELPDLAERIQVGLLNILEEQDIQIRGFQVRLPLDLMVIASANPEDYTNRGRIITPLKDRFGSQIRTHYPLTTDLEMEIVDQEMTMASVSGVAVTVPDYMREIIAEISHVARRSPDVSQRSGVSVRMTVANMEAMIANAQRRALTLGEDAAVPRMSDLNAILPSMLGKIELETLGESRDEAIVDRIIGDAIKHIFSRTVDPSRLDPLLLAFDNGLTLDVSDQTKSFDYVHQVSAVEGFGDLVASLGANREPASIASAVEFVIEGLYRNRKLSRRLSRSGHSYQR
ncbi:MAG: AAA family ATPase [Thermomicrobiales bacterium]